LSFITTKSKPNCAAQSDSSLSLLQRLDEFHFRGFISYLAPVPRLYCQVILSVLLQARGDKGTVRLKYEYYRFTVHLENIFQISVGITN